LYLIGLLVLGGLMAGLIYCETRSEPAPVPVTTQTQPAEPPPPPLYAPPPPPPPTEEPEEEEEGVADAGAGAGKTPAAAGTGGAPKGPCGGKCGDGELSTSLTSAVNATARSAQGCYNRALRTGEASGRMMVSVQVGSTGTVCSASILQDSVHSGEIASCVLGRFRGKSFPPPKSGCVVVNVPINFTIKQ
jgi:outer membrane biosynthesis protein TonB